MGLRRERNFFWEKLFPCVAFPPTLTIAQLTKTQRLLLAFFSIRKLETASAAARYLFEEEKIAESTYWFSLRRLKKMGLLEYGQSMPVRVTRFGDDCVLLLAQKDGGENEAGTEVNS